MSWTTVAIAIALLLLAAPYVRWVRHPRQQPFAAYLVFVTVFCLACVVLFLLLGWMVGALGIAGDLGRGGLALLLIVLGVVPALLVATWQARQPPSDRGPPE